jgi:hypothetical protein
MKPVTLLVLALASSLGPSLSCSSSTDNSTGSNADAGPAGGPVSGALDAHCAAAATVDPATCNGDTSAGGAPDVGSAGASNAGGAPDCNQTHDTIYGDTLYNSEGDDDDCKYHASWTSTPIRLNENVTFTLSAANKETSAPLDALADGKVPLTRLDVYEPCVPNRRGPTQNFNPQIAKTAPGVFTVGPIKFDQPGRWVVRFHLYEQCVDSDTSPHGHIAFFVDVP